MPVDIETPLVRLVGRDTAMKLSAKVEYACLAIIAARLRQDQDEAPVRARVIAEGNAIPEKYLVQILLQLKAANLVRSTRVAAGIPPGPARSDDLSARGDSRHRRARPVSP